MRKQRLRRKIGSLARRAPGTGTQTVDAHKLMIFVWYGLPSVAGRVPLNWLLLALL